MVSDTIRDDSRPRGSALRIPLLAALVAAAVAALFAQPRVVDLVREGALHAGWLFVAPAAFSVVLAIGAVAAWRGARRRGYFSGRALVQLAMAFAFVGVLAPSSFQEYRSRTAPPSASVASLEELFQSKDARVRELVVEAAGHRALPDRDLAPLLRRSLDDGNPRVRLAGVAAVERRAGRPLAREAREPEARKIIEAWLASSSPPETRP